MRLVRVAVVLLFASLLSVGTSYAEESSKYVAPRGPGGEHPDLNGIWQALNEANYDIERHVARPAMQLREGPYGPLPAAAVLPLGAVGAVPPGAGVVENGGIPYTAEALAKKKENQQNWLDRDPEVKCYLPGVPRATYMPQPFQIFQGEDSVFIAYQYAGAVRDIFMDDPGLAPVDSWMGWSDGHWEGDTLVVLVTGLNEQTWFDRAGNHHSAQIRVVERYTPMGPNHLLYEATIEDPETFTKPWKISMPLYRRMEANAQLMDFRCVEFVEELMYGEWRRHPLDR
ncbi:MAG: hypothetical protein E2O59_05060 [Gammaproteobacteria bacterium]|nr:MAG: hypothetical protein E2O59_05060 [Gammaproteobacteria bacterium]